MPDDKDLQLSKKLEDGEEIIEKKEERGAKIERADIDVGKEGGKEVISPEKRAVFKEKKPDLKRGVEAGEMFAVGSLVQKRQQRKKQIEKVLAEDLEDIYLHLPPDKQQEFKKVGEETSQEINSLLDKAKIKIKKIISLIKKWLLIIPGINKFFLEQEAKIKADEIMKINKEKS